MLVFPVLIGQLLSGKTGEVYLCVLTLVLMELPGWAERRLNVILPPAMESLLLVFIFASEILGEVRGCYIRYPGWDALLHGTSGFLFAAIGYAIPELAASQGNGMEQKLRALFAICFSLSVGVVWEFLEWGLDGLFGLDMQKDTVISTLRSVCLGRGREPGTVSGIRETVLRIGDGSVRVLEGYLDVGLHDTMGDLLVDLAGAAVLGFLSGNEKCAENFIPKAAFRGKR